MKKTSIGAAPALLAALLVSASALAQICEMTDRKTVELGLDQGISGRCSNNGEPITCFLDDNMRWQCDGPMGTFHGDNVDDVVIEACQCSPQEEFEMRQRDELMGD